MNNIHNVLILCTGNSARSILAEAIFNRLGKGKFNAWSAGSQPKGQVHPGALAQLKLHAFDVSTLRSKSWDEFAIPGAPAMDIVITVCDNAAGETCPLWPGQPIRAHWGLADPAAVTSSPLAQEAAFAACFEALTKRIEKVVALPVETFDRMALQHALRAIHQEADAT